MAKLPAFQFYPADWRKDPAVQSLSFHDRGVWFEILCLMHESEQRGKLLLNGTSMPDEALARLLGLDKQILTKTISTLLQYGVASRDENGALMNRRMVRDETLRQIRREAGKLGGNPVLVKQNATKPQKELNQNFNQNSTPSSSSSTAFAKEEKNSARASWLGDAQDLLTKLYGGLGASEAQLLDQQIEQMAAKTIRGSPVTLADVKRFTSEKELPQVRFLANLFSSWVANQNRGINGSFTRQSSTEGSGHSPARKERELDTGKSI